MKIEKIIYETTRELLTVEQKIKIATVFLFCQKLGSKKLSELLYADNHEKFIKDLNIEHKDHEVDFSIDFSDKNIKNSFYKTLEKLKEKWDRNGFLKAVHEKDPFAFCNKSLSNQKIKQLKLF